MSEPFVGQVIAVGFNFAPVGWALCQGQLLPINQNTALFSLVGTYYGGNGTSNFALPDLRGRVPIHQGSGPGLSPVQIGEVSGDETVTLLQNEMPPHNHPMPALAHAATATVPAPVATGEMASPATKMPEAATHVASATEAATHVASATEAAAHVATTADPATMASATPAATRRRDVRSNSDQRGDCQQSDHRFTQHY